MGLDDVELIMATEDIFGISIGDEVASKLRTVDDLHQCVLTALAEKSALTTDDICLSSRAFRHLRSAAVAAFDISPRTLRPSTPLSVLLSSEPAALRRQWENWKSASGLHIPRFWRASQREILTMTIVGRIAGLVCFALVSWQIYGAIFRATPPFRSWPVWLLLILAGLIAAFASAHAKVERELFIPTTMRELTLETMNSDPAWTKSLAGGRFTRGNVWPMLVAVISNQLGVPSYQVIPEARFREDLHMG